MRTLKIQTQITLDGYMGGPAGEQDWTLQNWGPDVGAHVVSIMEGVDTILLGRTLAEGFIPFWAANPEMDGAEFFNTTAKQVMSNTLTESPWAGTEILSGDFIEAVTALKESEGGDIIAYGGARLVSGLIRAGLADQVHAFVNPVAIGGGLPLFGSNDSGAAGYLRFDTTAVTPFECGIVALDLRPAQG